MVTEQVTLGRRLSRDIFLCLGGAMSLIAAGGLFGNLPDILRYHDWPPSEMDNLFLAVAVYAVCGVIFLTAAYGLFRKKNWGPAVAIAVSALAIFGLLLSGAEEGYDPSGAVMMIAFYGTPLFVTLVWASTELMRQKKHRMREGRRGLLA